MRLAISNLAWPATQDNFVFDRLVRLGIGGVEIAPTRFAPWSDLSTSLLADRRAVLDMSGLVTSSLQAVLFGRPELQLLGEATTFDGMVDHFRHLADIATILGAGILVFGAPRNRLRGEMDPGSAWSCARDRLRLLGELVCDAGITIGIEPVPIAYGGDFLTSWSEVLNMVRDVDHQGVRVHLDTGCVALGGDSIEAAIRSCKDVLAHFHAAQPQLSGFQNPLPQHEVAAMELHAMNYSGWVAIEMKEQPDDPIAGVDQAVRIVRKLYGV